MASSTLFKIAAMLGLGAGIIIVVKKQPLLRERVVKLLSAAPQVPSFSGYDIRVPMKNEDEAYKMWQRNIKRAKEAAALGQGLVYDFTVAVDKSVSDVVKDPYAARLVSNMLRVSEDDFLSAIFGVSNVKDTYGMLAGLEKAKLIPSDSVLHDLMGRIEAEFTDAGWTLVGKGGYISDYEERLKKAALTAAKLDPGTKPVHTFDLLTKQWVDIEPSKLGTIVFYKGKWTARYSDYAGKISEPFTAVDKIREAGGDVSWLSYKWS